MKKKKQIKMGNRIIKMMRSGSLPYTVASYFDISLETFYSLIEENPILKDKFMIAWTKLNAHYEQQLAIGMVTGRGDKDLIKLFYSHYFEIIEKKAGVGATEQNEVHSTEFAE